MNQERNNQQDQNKEQNTSNPTEEKTTSRSSAFNEPSPDAQKSNSNIEEADMEQERKEAMTERD